MADDAEIGKVGWIDITVDDATGLSDFYARVTGWKPNSVSMGDYSDFVMMMPGSDHAAAGICHARGSNAELPRQWLIYIIVADADKSAAECTARGGKVLVAPRPLSGGRFCVIEDPSGAIAGLFQTA